MQDKHVENNREKSVNRVCLNFQTAQMSHLHRASWWYELSLQDSAELERETRNVSYLIVEILVIEWIIYWQFKFLSTLKSWQIFAVRKQSPNSYFD